MSAYSANFAVPPTPTDPHDAAPPQRPGVTADPANLSPRPAAPAPSHTNPM